MVKRRFLSAVFVLSLAISILLDLTPSPAQTNRVLPVAVGDNATVRLTRVGLVVVN